MGNNSKYFTVVLAIVGVMAAATLLAFSEDWDAGWRITPSLSVNKVHFTVRSTNIHGRWSNSRDVPLDRFRGFSLSMLASPGTAKFEYVADAGRCSAKADFWWAQDREPTRSRRIPDSPRLSSKWDTTRPTTISFSPC